MTKIPDQSTGTQMLEKCEVIEVFHFISWVVNWHKYLDLNTGIQILGPNYWNENTGT